MRFESRQSQLPLVAFILLVGLSCGTTKDRSKESGTKSMVARLAALTQRERNPTNIYENQIRYQAMRGQSLPETEPDRSRAQFQLGHQALFSNHPHESAAIFSKLREKFQERIVNPDIAIEAARWEAISYLRLGELENCLESRTASSCIFPLTGEGIHNRVLGSQSAVASYRWILDRRPNDLEAIWLINIATMTLGPAAEELPPSMVLPEDRLGAEHVASVSAYRDEAASRGVDISGLSGGSIVDDFDNDGDFDLMCSSWGLGDQIQYRINDGSGVFSDGTRAANLVGITGGLNLVHADYDNDGDQDVYVTRGAWRFDNGLFPNSLLQNQGGGVFADVTEDAGLLDFHPGQTAAWGDFDNDGDLDLFVGYESVTKLKHPCALFENSGDGHFTDVAHETGIDIAGFVKAAQWADFDGDGWLDLYVSVLGGPNRLMTNLAAEGKRRVRFEDRAAEAGVTHPIDSFPICIRDYDQDGDLDIFVSAYSYDFLNSPASQVAADYMGLDVQRHFPCLYLNRGDGHFADLTRSWGLDWALFTMGLNSGDLNGDGFPDLYLGTGAPDLRALMPNRFFINRHGTGFIDATRASGLGHLQKGHGISMADFNSDGNLDIYAVMGGAYRGDSYPNALFMNSTKPGSWLLLKLRGTTSNRDGLNARVRARFDAASGPRIAYTWVQSGSSFGGSPIAAWFAVKPGERLVDLEITWHGSGTVQHLSDLALNQTHQITEAH